MKEMRLFQRVFVLSVVSCMVVVPIYALIKQSLSLTPNGFLDLRNPALTILVGILLGGVLGIIMGCISGIFSAFATNVFGPNRLPLWSIALFSFLIGLLVFLFFFGLLLDTHLTFTSVINRRWPGLTVDFVGGFLIAFVPLIIAKSNCKR